MSKRKFKKGAQVLSVAELLEHDWFIVHFGPRTVKTLHKSFIGSWQLLMCERFVDAGQVYIAERLTNGEYYPNLSDKEIQERLDEGLCDYCPLPEELHGMHLGPNGPYGCEGSRCDKAIEAWKEEYVE